MLTAQEVRPATETDFSCLELSPSCLWKHLQSSVKTEHQLKYTESKA